MKYNKGLTCSRVTILSPRECEVFYPGVVTNNMMCAGLDHGQDPCQVGIGQGGSPLRRGKQRHYGKTEDPALVPSLVATPAKRSTLSNTLLHLYHQKNIRTDIKIL